MASERRESLAFKARLSESASRFDEMVNDVRELVAALPNNQSLTAEERNLLAVAFKFEVGTRRRVLKTLQKISTETRMVNPTKAKEFHDFKETISRELEGLCNDLIWMLDSKLIPGVKEPTDDIFYHKLKGDYYRYLAEVEENAQKAAEYIQKAKESYQGATEYSLKELAASHPLRIGLAMNYSVFIQEMLGNTAEARDHAKRFYDDALDEVEGVRDVDEKRYNECVYLIKLMHANIKVWSMDVVDTKTRSKEF